ncbi:MAG: hypothetical protein CMJ58_17420 [Planctomycetaceae bacterium]|nr:hypothetical protein [Planctomycetaceae bacterium]
MRAPVLAAVCCALVSASAAAAAETGYVYAYFKGGWPAGGHSGVFLSYSADGLHFDSMNGGEAVFVPPEVWSDAEDQTRDPSVVYGPDGLFHMVWTSGIETRTIGYASSPNLIDWSAPQLVEIWDPATVVNHTWAPEIFYDAQQQHYQIVFASDPDDGDHKQYVVTTSDFAAYSEPSVFYYNNATVIDAMVARDAANDRYLMAIKDEQGGAKNIRLATGPTALGPWTTDNPIIVGPGSSIEGNVTEGPSLLQIGDTWYLYYDAYGAGYLGVAASTDPTDPSSWVNLTEDSTMPEGPDAHHGTVFAAPLSALVFDSLPFARSDLNGDQAIDLADWGLFSTHQLTDLTGLSPAEQAARGDLNGDGRADYFDFQLFKRDFDSLHGGGSFAARLNAAALPEPSAVALAIVAWAACCRRVR